MSRVTLTERDNQGEVHLSVDDELVVRLEANPGTGYSWNVAGEEEIVLDRLGEPTFERLGEPKPGGVEHQVFTFRVRSKGESSLRLDYRRSWEKQKAAEKSFSVRVFASE
jgi:inhibitor of cysteine peptidase